MSATPDIFLSYNREDAEVARRFAAGFEAAGLDVWWDQALRSGEAYDEVTEAALRGAKAVVVLWSSRSVASRWVRSEATIAERGGTLMPVRIEPCDLPVMFELTQTADLVHWQGAADDKAWLAFLSDVWRMVGKEAPEPDAPAPASTPAATSTGAGVPQAGVLPFTIRGSDEDLAFLAEDLTEDVTHALAENDYFKVIASGTMSAWRGKAHDYRAIGQQIDARYLIEGKVQRSGDAIRLAVQLIDTDTANTVWSHRFAEWAAEIAANPDDFPRIVASELAEHVMQAEMKRALAMPGPCTGWEHVLRCMSYNSVYETGNNEIPGQEARSAVAVAPDFGLAHATLASSIVIESFGKGGFDDRVRREIREHATRALQLDGDNSVVLTRLVLAHIGLGDSETPLRLAKRAVELRPASPRSHYALAAAYMYMARTGDAIAAFASQLSCKGFDSTRSSALHMLGWCHLLEGRPQQAQEFLDDSLALNPNYGTALMFKAIAEALLGKEDSAVDTMQRLREIQPDNTVEEHLGYINAFKPLIVQRSGEHIAIFRRLWNQTEDDA